MQGLANLSYILHMQHFLSAKFTFDIWLMCLSLTLCANKIKGARVN